MTAWPWQLTSLGSNGISVGVWRIAPFYLQAFLTGLVRSYANFTGNEP